MLLEGASVLAAKLGVSGGGPTQPVSSYRWHRSPALPIHLLTTLALPCCRMPAGAKVLASAGRLPLLAAAKAGRGTLLFSALPLEPARSEVYQYNLFLLDAVSETFAVTPPFAAADLGVFVDWGYHITEEPAALAARLHAWHIRHVSYSAWYDRDDYRRFTRAFLAAAHRNGLLVEAWFELPMVSIPFWQQHPEWREVTAAGTPAKLDWRSLMALEDPPCLAAVEDYLGTLVQDFDWDGVNCAELYFESPGFDFRPDMFTPMHPAFRRDFQRDYGVDPRTCFDEHSPNYWKTDPRLRQALIDSRTALITRLHEELLRLCARWQQQKPYLHTTLTVVDTLLDHSMTERIGVDSAQLLALNARYPFLPLIEDPFTLWSLGADRYRVLIARYRPQRSTTLPLAVDINIAERIPAVDVPTPVQRGLELYSLVAAAETHADVTYLYADQSLDRDDMALAVCALGSRPLARTRMDKHVIPQHANCAGASPRTIWRCAWSAVPGPASPPTACSFPRGRTRLPPPSLAPQQARASKTSPAPSCRRNKLRRGSACAIAATAAVSSRCAAPCRRSPATGNAGMGRFSRTAAAPSTTSPAVNMPLPS